MGEKNNSTFLIKSSADRNRSFGTGFCVHKDDKGSFLLTAGHVVDSCGRDHLLVASFSATLLHISQDNDTLDLALIYVEGLINSSPLKLSNEKAKENDEFTIVGYRPHKNDHAKEPLKGSIKKAYPLESKHIRNIYELTINDGDSIEQGYSGSAVVSAVTGLVIAIATDRKRDGKQAFATPAYYLREIWKDIPNNLFQSLSNLNPYKGLNSFGYDDQANYYGREEEAKEIAKTLKTTRLLTLLGASGSGKSSLIYAGVVPLIEENGVEILTFRPLDNPLKSLASLFIPLLYEDKLEQLRKEKELANDLLKNSITITQLVEQLLEKKRAKHLYLVIDQFEELFTLTDDKEHRGAFLAKVLELITGTLPVTLLISMRADFLTYLSYSDSLNEVYNNHPNKMLAILKKEKLRAVIEKPALALGVTFADGLVEKIIEEIEQEAGQLPLLEFALEQLWRHKKGRVISFETLEQIGSITQSISHYADSVYERYPNLHNSIKRVLINLVSPGSGRADTKKMALFNEFNEADKETILKLSDERLIVTTEQEVKEKSEKTIEIVHEALIREWKQLKDWLDEYREFLVWQERVREDRVFYKENGDLLKDSKLLVAKNFLGSHGEYVSKGDRGFVEESIKKDNTNRRIKILSIIFLLIVLTGVALFFWKLKNNEEKATEKLAISIKGYLERTQNSDISFENKKKIYSFLIDDFKNEENVHIIKIVSRAYNNLGLIYKKDEKYENSIREYDEAIKRDIKYRKAYSNRGNAYLALSKYSNAINDYKKVLELNPKCKDYANLIETVSKRELPKDEELIENTLKDWEEKECKSYRPYFFIGSWYFKNENYEDAKKFAQYSLSRNTKNNELKYKSYTLLGKSYIQLNEFDEAIQNYKKALELEPKKSWLYVYIFTCQLVNDENYVFDEELEKEFLKLKEDSNKKIYEKLKLLQRIIKGEKNYLNKDINESFDGKWYLEILDNWINGFDEGEVKERLREAIGVFKGHGKID